MQVDAFSVLSDVWRLLNFRSCSRTILSRRSKTQSKNRSARELQEALRKQCFGSLEIRCGRFGRDFQVKADSFEFQPLRDLLDAEEAFAWSKSTWDAFLSGDIFGTLANSSNGPA